MTDPVPMTSDAQARLEAEIARLETDDRLEMAERIRIAREWGDLKENGEYHAAKEAQAHLETRILVLRDRLRRAEIVEPGSGDVVGMGSRVRVRDEGGRESDYTVAASHEADATRGLISSESPVGRALMGRRPGEETAIETPRGTRVLSILSVG